MLTTEEGVENGNLNIFHLQMKLFSLEHISRLGYEMEFEISFCLELWAMKLIYKAHKFREALWHKLGPVELSMGRLWAPELKSGQLRVAYFLGKLFIWAN